VVDPAVVRISGAFRFPGVLNLGGVSGQSLLARSKWGGLCFAFLFAGNIRHLAARDFWAEAWVVAIVVAILTGSFGLMGAGGFSAYLLLLPRRLLQRILG
jgi:hypothetical protein